MTIATNYRSRNTISVYGNRCEMNHQPPLTVNRLYSDGTHDIRTSLLSGGLCNGDRLEYEINVGPGSSCRVIPVASEIFHAGGNGEPTEVKITVNLADNSFFQYAPVWNIPCRDALIRQEIVINAAPTARFAYFDGWTAGRVHSGEKWQYAMLQSRIRVSVDGRLIYQEHSRLTGQGSEQSRCGLNDCDRWSTELEYGLSAQAGRGQSKIVSEKTESQTIHREDGLTITKTLHTTC